MLEYFPQQLHNFTFLPAMHEDSDFSISSNTLFSDFLILDILVSMKWYFIVAFIYISLMTNDNVHIFPFLLAMCISGLEKCRLRSFAFSFFFFSFLWPCQVASE